MLLRKHSALGRAYIDRHEAKPFEEVTARTLFRELWIHVTVTTLRKVKVIVFFLFMRLKSINANYLINEAFYQNMFLLEHSRVKKKLCAKPYPNRFPNTIRPLKKTKQKEYSKKVNNSVILKDKNSKKLHNLHLAIT